MIRVRAVAPGFGLGLGNFAINGGADAEIRGARPQKLSNIGQIYFCFV